MSNMKHGMIIILKSVSITIKSPGILWVPLRGSALDIPLTWAFVRCSIKAVDKPSCLTSIHTKSFHRISSPCKNISHWILKQVQLSVVIVLFFGPPTTPELISQPLSREAQVTEWWQVVVSWRGIGQAWKTGPLSAPTYFYSPRQLSTGWFKAAERERGLTFLFTDFLRPLSRMHTDTRTHARTHAHTHQALLHQYPEEAPVYHLNVLIHKQHSSLS